jgi:hypothetical protein
MITREGWPAGFGGAGYAAAAVTKRLAANAAVEAATNSRLVMANAVGSYFFIENAARVLWPRSEE